MDHVLSVSLDKSTTPWSVDIDQHGNANQVPRSPHRQTLAWELTGNAASGDLLPLQWVEPPRDGIFGPPQVTDHGQRMTMTDLNNGQDSAGTWIYMLSLTLDGQQYSTLTTIPTGTTTNPSIKNH